MKTLNTALLIVFFLTICNAFGQDESVLYEAYKWRQGQTKVLYGHEVEKKESKGYGYTHISYRDVQNLIKDAELRAEKEMWTSEKKVSEINEIKSFAPGGIISLHIGRITIGTGNTDNFTIIVQDNSGSELYREELEEEIPEVPSSDDLWLEYWFNLFETGIRLADACVCN